MNELTASGDVAPERGTVSHLVDQWFSSRLDVTDKTRLQYEWAAGHIQTGLGALRLDQLVREDVAAWLDGLAVGGGFSRRSMQIFRMVLRTALADAVDPGEIRRSPAARVGTPRWVAKPNRSRETAAWDESELQRLLRASADHRWGGPDLTRPTCGNDSELLGDPAHPG